MSDTHPPQGPPPGHQSPPGPPGPHDPTPSTSRRPWYRKKRVLIPAGVLAFFIAIGALSGGAEDGPEPATTATPTVEPTAADESTAEDPAAEEAAEEDRAAREAEEVAQAEEEARQAEEERLAAEAAAAEEEAARAGTVSQQNAYRAAKNYLSFTAFSRTGLVKQLTSEYGDGYPPEDAEFAVARLEAEGEVDWFEQAVKSAENYLGFTSFSRSGLIQQLTSEYGDGFTQEQAEHAADEVGL